MKISGVKRGIQKRIVMSMLIIGIIPLIIGAYFIYIDSKHTLERKSGANFQNMAKKMSVRLKSAIDKQVAEIRMFAALPDIVYGVNTGVEEGSMGLLAHMKRLKEIGGKNIRSIFIVNLSGRYVAGINEAKKRDYSNEGWFRYAADNKGKAYIYSMRSQDATDVSFMGIAAPIMNKGRVIGVLTIRYNIDELSGIIRDVSFGTSGHALLLDSKGSSLIPFISVSHNSYNAGSSLINILNSSAGPGWAIVNTDADGSQLSVIGFASVGALSDDKDIGFGNNRWYVIVSQNYEEIYLFAYALFIRVFIFGFLMITILAVIGVVVTRDIVGPVNELYKGAKLIGQGNLDYRLNIKTNDEIEKLADEFNNMAEELKKIYTVLEERNKELKTSEERYKDLVENSPEMIHSVNADRYFIDVNKTELDILGYSLSEMRNKKIDDIIPPEFRNTVKGHIERTIKDGMGKVELQFIAKDGKKIDVDMSATALYHPVTNQFIKIRAFLRDITDRKRLERHLKGYYETLAREVNDKTRELKETKDYLENLLETANDVISTLSPDGIIKYVNKKVEDWGYKKEELIGNSFSTVLSGRYRDERLSKAVMEGIRETYEAEVIDKSGEIKYVALSVSPLRGNDGAVAEILCIANDITEQKRLEHQIAQAEKMSAIGQLAAGLAHEINNPIGGILNCLYNIRMKSLSETRVEEYLKSMEDGIHRVHQTVDQLLDFSQQHQPELTIVRMNNLVKDVISLINYAITKNNITLDLKLDPQLPPLMLDQHKMGQVVMNILLNAIQAIDGKGRIEVRTFQGGGWYCLDITDDGKGIPANILPKIFDPFFTTKDVGKGTGLGLAVSLGIVEQHSGRLEVKSIEGKGSTFTIKLPIKVQPVSVISKTW